MRKNIKSTKEKPRNLVAIQTNMKGERKTGRKELNKL